MRRRPRAVGLAGRLAALLLLGAAPVAAQTGQADNALLGKVYEGVLNSRIIPPEGSGIRPQSHHGRATAVLEATGDDTAQFILNGTLAQDGDASFVAPGRLSDQGWAGGSDSFRLTIGSEGGVRGEGVFEGQPMTFDGTFRGDDLDLVVEITVPRETAGGLPAGTLVQFGYRLRHFPPRPEGAVAATADGGCREVVYRLKLTPNLFGGGLSSVRVPECVQ